MSKIDENKDILIEINLAEAPLFNFAKVQKTYLIEDVLKNDLLSSEARDVLDYLRIQSNTNKVDYRHWSDSSGKSRELIVTSSGGFPNAYCMDVFFGLIRLFIKKNSPLEQEENGTYKFKSNKVNFTMNELCDAMEIKNGGNTNKKIINALRTLKLTNYFSIDSIYSKEKKSYEKKGEKSISLLESYDISKLVETEDGKRELFIGKAVFGDLIMSNLELGFARVVRNHQYFKLTSGITRGIYTYLESNKNSSTTYLKRSLEVLGDKIPIEFKYPSLFKSKVKKPLQNLIEAGVISAYFYGDEYKVNGVKEQCIYFIFKGTKATIIKQLEEEYAKKHPKLKSPKEKKKEALEQELELEFPENIKQELIDFGINSKKIAEIMQKYSKYKIAEYILWLKDGILKGKAKEPAGMFVFAITDEMVKVNRTHPYISEFVAKYKAEVEGKIKYEEIDIKNAYKEYMQLELDEFKKDDEFMFDSLYSSTLDDIEETMDKKIKSQRLLYNMAESKDEKEKIMKIIDKWEKFPVEKEDSELFTEMFVKRISTYRGLKLYEDFRRDYIQKNS